MDFSSKLVENAVEQISYLPGIGKRTALRLALHLLNQPLERTTDLAQALINLKTQIKHCEKCHNISDKNICEICTNSNRNQALVCVVEDIRDVMAIENTNQYKGVYHVLGGKISPMDGVGPHQLNIQSLVEKVSKGKVDELIFALSSTMEGDTTNFFIYNQIKNLQVVVSTIARGISVGDELEFADQVSLGRSIIDRVPFQIAQKS